jgi:hypothetical protein
MHSGPRIIAGDSQKLTMSRRDLRIIHLHDKPLHTRTPARSRYPASKCNAVPVLWCLMIVGATVAFFWIYDLVGHHDLPSVPTLSRTPRPVAVKSMRHDETPSPDMKSPEVLRANADVATDLTTPAEITVTEKSFSLPMAERHRGPPKNKIGRVSRKHLPPEASHSYGAAPDYFRSLFRKF